MSRQHFWPFITFVVVWNLGIVGALRLDAGMSFLPIWPFQ